MSHNDQSTNLILTQMKATIIILPPFLHSCKVNVPAAFNTNATTTTTQTSSTTSKTNKKNDIIRIGSHTSNNSDGSCFHREQQHKNYGKHATKSSTAATTRTRASEEEKEELEVKVEVEVVEEDNSSSSSSSSSSDNEAVKVELNKSSNIRGSRYGRQQQHRKYFHTHCVSLLAKQQQHQQQQQHNLQEAEYQQHQLKNIMPTMQQLSAVDGSQQTTATTNSCSSINGTTTTNAKPTRRRKSIKISSFQRSGGGDHQIINKVVADIEVDTDQMTKSLKTTTRTNSCLADKFKLRNSQLVMPIAEEADDDAEDEDEEKGSRLVEVEENKVAGNSHSNKTTCSDMLLLARSRQITATTRWTTSLAGAATTNKNKNNNNNNDNDNISQTTTLECRCFKDNGDIIERMFNETKKGSFISCSSSGCSGSKRMNDEKLLPRRTITTATTIQEQQKQQQQQQQQQQRLLLLSRQQMPLAATSAALRSSQLMKTIALSSKFSMVLMLLMMLTTSANCWAGRQDVPTNCTFPARWEGSWFLSGYQQSIHIKGSQFSYRGKCAASDGNKYLIVDEKGCHRCLVIYEKHKNVLQYKESECEGDSMYMHQSNPSAMAMRSVLKQSDHRGGAHPNSNGHSRLSSSDQYIMRSNDDMNDYFCKGRETLQNLCDQIPGDALLYSLFRESAEPIKCPLKGPFVFTYNRGHGECKNPVSNIESCTEESRLLLSFQACPDVHGTESTVEELTCLANWKDGNSRYLVGLVSHHHAISNEERYRCFVYEKISSILGGPSIVTTKDFEYKLAQSGDATCNGLDSAEVGSRIMSLRNPPLAERCDFPVWFKGPRHWHALMGNAVYNYHSNEGSVHIIKPNGYMETRALCEQINKQTSTEMMAVVHYTTGCQSGFMCMMFYRRDTHVIEIQTGKQASRLEDACAPDHFDINRMPYITLLASNPDPQICPMEGLYSLRGAIGPPYLTTRHKRNHNNKAHGGHGHHHLPQSEAGVSGGANGNGFAHKRHGTLSFRNSDKIEQGSWHANTRGLPVRSRRDAISTTNAPTAHHMTNGSNSTINSVSINKEITLYNVTSSSNTTAFFTSENVTSVAFASTNSITGRDRRRRDAPGCVTNYKAQRQLWVGCTEPNVIDVRPLCNDDGDEEYSCHGSWTENGTVYIITRHKGTKHGVCISYRPTEGTAAKLVIGDACYRGTLKPPEHHLVANLSVFGKCGETGSASTQIHINNWLGTLAVAISILAATLLGQLQFNTNANGR